MNIFNSRTQRRSVCAAVGLLLSLVAPTVPAQQRERALADAALQRDAEILQRCLESQLAPWQVESTVSADGKIADTVRMTRWGSVPNGDCASRIAASGGSCESPRDLQRVVRLEFDASEAHPVWSANDRARLEDLIPSTLMNMSGNVQLRPAHSRGADATDEVLRVRLDYRGMSALQRDVEEWVRGPRELIVTMTLVDASRGNRVRGIRTLTLRQSPQLRERYSATSTTRWMTQLLAQIDTTAQSLTASLACDTPWLDVTVERGKIWLSSDGYAGLREGRSVLLVPTADSALASRWPIARIRNLAQGNHAELEVVRGSAELCEAGCRAIPL